MESEHQPDQTAILCDVTVTSSKASLKISVLIPGVAYPYNLCQTIVIPLSQSSVDTIMDAARELQTKLNTTAVFKCVPTEFRLGGDVSSLLVSSGTIQCESVGLLSSADTSTTAACPSAASIGISATVLSDLLVPTIAPVDPIYRSMVRFDGMIAHSPLSEDDGTVQFTIAGVVLIRDECHVRSVDKCSCLFSVRYRQFLCLVDPTVRIVFNMLTCLQPQIIFQVRLSHKHVCRRTMSHSALVMTYILFNTLCANNCDMYPISDFGGCISTSMDLQMGPVSSQPRRDPIAEQNVLVSAAGLSAAIGGICAEQDTFSCGFRLQRLPQ